MILTDSCSPARKSSSAISRSTVEVLSGAGEEACIEDGKGHDALCQGYGIF